MCACAQPANFFHFYTVLGPSQGMALPEVGESFYFIYAIKIIAHRQAQGPISQVLLDFFLSCNQQ